MNPHGLIVRRLLDIFVRANEGGTKLSKSDLLLSMITSEWSGINARDEIYNFVDRLNTDLTRKNDFDKDFIMKSCLVLSDLPVAYKVLNFNVKNLSLIQSKWQQIRNSIEKGVDVSNCFGLDRDNLTSVNALIPLAYYLFQHPEVNLRGDTPFDVKNSRIVRQWLISALLNNVFGGSSDNMLTTIRSVIKEYSKEPTFPIEPINKGVSGAGRTAYFDGEAFERFLSNTYGGKLTFLALSILYPENNWGIISYHQDHIFPKAIFTWSKMQEANCTWEQYTKYKELKEYIGNLELLEYQENQEKSDIPFDEWIRTRDDSFKNRHLIPDDPELWKFENFEAFMDKREDLIVERLSQLFD